MIRAIAFDWGGIFTEGTFDSLAVENLAAIAGVDREAVHAAYFPLMEEFEIGAFDLGGFIDRLVERTGSRTDEEKLASTFLASVRERAVMFRILAAIPGHYRVGMLSNNVPALCDRVRDDSRMQRIEHFVFSNEIGVRKPDPAAFSALSSALALEPGQIVFVDDNGANVEAARQLGFKAILLDTMEHFARQWQELLPDVPLPATPVAEPVA